jgi:prepilin peptidase CpaA
VFPTQKRIGNTPFVGKMRPVGQIIVKMDFPILFLIVTLGIASITDLYFFRIPNWLTLPALSFGVAHFTITKGFEGFLFSIAGTGTGFTLLLLPYIFGGTGAGDVKLLGAVGSFLGPKGIFAVFMISCILSGVYALILLASRGLLARAFKRYGKILWTFIYTRQLVFIKPSFEEKQIKVRHGLSIALGTGSYLAFWL